MRHSLLALLLVLGACNSGTAQSPDLARLPDVDAAAPDAVADDVAVPADLLADAPRADITAPPHPWPACPEWAAIGPSLADKAAALDELVERQHLADGLLRTVTLDGDGNVAALHHLPSSGLWTAMYLASQSYRWATTGDEQALANARIAVAGLHDLTAVTGVPGLYGRAYHRPDFDYAWQPSPEGSWAESTVPGYEGWWFNYTVSKDTMDGIMYGYAAALELLEDEELLATVRADVFAFANHLVGNGLQIIDIDGKVTEHGRLYHSAMDDFPGFNALLASSWLRVAIAAGAGPEIVHFYEDCMMRLGDSSDCPDFEAVDLGPYIDSIETLLSLYMQNCQTNFDHFDMVFQAIEPLLKRETDPGLAKRLADVLEVGIWQSGDPASDPPVYESTHSLYILMYGALSAQTPGDPVFEQALEEAICTLYQIPQDRHDHDVPAGTQEGVCLNRFGNPNAAHPIPVQERVFDNYLWRLDSYEVPIAHTGNPDLVHSPEDFLLAYWLGRYYGFIAPDM